MNSILTIDTKGIPSNADKSNKTSVNIAKYIYDSITNTRLVNQNTITGKEKVKGQTSDSIFEKCTMQFLQATFPYLQHLRPGTWHVLQLGNQNTLKTSSFAQYEHLAYLAALTKANTQLATCLGNNYMVAPDVIIYRELCEDEELIGLDL